MSDKYCFYCLPSGRRSHLDLKIDYYAEKVRRVFFAPFQFLEPKNWKNPDLVWIGVLNFLHFLGGVEFVADPEREQILNRALILLDEAKKRGIEIEAIKIFGSFKNEFRYRIGQGNYKYFETNPLAKIWDSNHLDQKIVVKKMLQNAGLPVPEGKMFTSFKKARDFGRSLGFPLAVKPNSGSLGHHSTYPVRNLEELERAVRIAQMYKPDFIVERYLSGGNYRATVIGGEHVLISQKEMPNVTGDGNSTIEELIAEKNKDPRRGDHDKKNQSLFWILITDEMKQSLAGRGLSLEFVPKQGEKIYLYDRYLPGSGFDIVDHTEVLHPESRNVFIKAADALDADLAGFDFICTHPAKHPGDQVFGILEANSVPYIDMHAFPSVGEGQDVAKLVWDTVLEKIVM